MTIAEPMTLITDYLLGGFTGWLGMLLLKSLVTRWWGIAFIALALAAFIGGTYHGFPQFYPAELWAATLFCAGAASFALVIAAATGTGFYPRFFFWFALLKFMVYAALSSRSGAFIYVVVDSGVALLVVAVLHALRRDAARRWMLGGVAVSIVAALVQALKLAPHAHFNHNDLYHVIQIGAIWLFYRGAKQIQGRSPN